MNRHLIEVTALWVSEFVPGITVAAWRRSHAREMPPLERITFRASAGLAPSASGLARGWCVAPLRGA